VTKKEAVVLVGSTTLGVLEGFLIGALIGQLPITTGVKLVLIVGLSGIVGYTTGWTLGRKFLS